jgi:Carboxypeptidase regulatory-like domain
VRHNPERGPVLRRAARAVGEGDAKALSRVPRRAPAGPSSSRRKPNRSERSKWHNAAPQVPISRQRLPLCCEVIVLFAVIVAASPGGTVRYASLTGTVADRAGHPLSGAAIVVGDGTLRRATVTDTNGRYHLDDLRLGRSSVHVFAPGKIYDAGHQLPPLRPGTNRHDVRLEAQPPRAGPRFRRDPTAAFVGRTLHLQAAIDPGPGSPVGDELLAIDTTDHIAVLLRRSPSGIASAQIRHPDAYADAAWIFVATDKACQEALTFPVAVQLS